MDSSTDFAAFGQIHAICLPQFLVLMLRWANHLLAVALLSHIDLDLVI